MVDAPPARARVAADCRRVDDSVAPRVARSVFFNACEAAVAFATGTASGILVPRILGPHRMGIYSLLLGWLGVASLIASLGLAQTCMKFSAELKGRNDHAGIREFVTWSLLIQSLAGVVAWAGFAAAAGWLSRGAHLPHLALAVQLAGVVVLLDALTNCLLLAVRGIQRFDLIVLNTVVGAPVSAVIIVTATTIGIQWRKVAGAVVAPVTLVALYAVWRWRRDD